MWMFFHEGPFLVLRIRDADAPWPNGTPDTEKVADFVNLRDLSIRHEIVELMFAGAAGNYWRKL
jgi:hypothetical protein